MSISELEKLSLAKLRHKPQNLRFNSRGGLKKEELIVRIRKAEATDSGEEVRGGILEIMNEGIGFLRTNHYHAGPKIFMSPRPSWPLQFTQRRPGDRQGTSPEGI